MKNDPAVLLVPLNPLANALYNVLYIPWGSLLLNDNYWHHDIDYCT